MEMIKKNKYILITFSGAFLIMTFSIANMKVFPFGNNQVLVIDAWEQYYPFLQELHQKVTSGESLLYTWRSGGGSNFFLIMAYYAMSPLNLIAMLFQKEYLREFFLLATILKISFAAMFFSIYLKEVYHKNDASIVVFGLMYAFSAYTMSFYWNIIWLDAVALLPLVLLGMHNLIEGKGFFLYTVSLTVILISNFYMGYMICFFILIYFFIVCFEKDDIDIKSRFINSFSRMALYSLISIGMSGIVLVPTYTGLQFAYAHSSGNPLSLHQYHSYFNLLERMLIHSQPAVLKGLPNIYTGLFAVLLSLFYFLFSSRARRERLVNFLLLLFFILSFNTPFLDYLWHGFRLPIGMYYRYVFIFSFVVLVWAYRAYLDLVKSFLENNGKLLLIIGALLASFFIIEAIHVGNDNASMFRINLVLLAIYGSLIFFYRHRKISTVFLKTILCCLVLGEIIFSANFRMGMIGPTDRIQYPKAGAEVEEVLSDLHRNDTGFYRVEMTDWQTMNDPVLNSYRGISQFSSTANSGYTHIARRMGLSSMDNIYVYSNSTPVVDMMYGVKYLIDRSSGQHVNQEIFEPIMERSGITLYRNKYDLPVGFMVEDAIKEWELSSMDPFSVQESFLSLATGHSVSLFEEVPPDLVQYDNVDIYERYRIHYLYRSPNNQNRGNVRLTYRLPSGKRVYAYTYDDGTGTVDLLLNDKRLVNDTYRGLISDLGIPDRESELEISFNLSAGQQRFLTAKTVVFDEEAFVQAHRRLSESVLDVYAFSENYLVGSVVTDKDGLLFTSIPYDSGWSARVNGESVEIEPLQNALISIPLSRGTHTIELSYFPPGVKAGALVSILSLVVFAFCCFNHLKKVRMVNQALFNGSGKE